MSEGSGSGPANRQTLAIGKIPAELLADLLAALPPGPPELLLGPRLGEDACAVKVDGDVLVVAADPITLTGDDLGPLSVVASANDVAVTGARPRWFLAVILIPPGTNRSTIGRLFAAIAGAVEGVGAHLVGGHTEVTSAVTRPVVVGQMLGVAEHGLVTSGGIHAGDAVVQIGPIPVEGAVVLARERADRLATLPPAVIREARTALDRPGICIVEPALLATRLGATALHDPTEGGLAAGLHELASAGEVALRVDRTAVIWFEPGIRICAALGADPWATLASGALLAAFPQSAASTATRAITEHGHRANIVATAEAGTGVGDTDGAPIPWPARDEVARLLADDA